MPASPAATPGKSGGNKDKNKRGAPLSVTDRAFKPIKEWYAENTSYMRMGAGLAVLYFCMLSSFFYRYCYVMGEQMSNPSIMFKAKSTFYSLLCSLFDSLLQS